MVNQSVHKVTTTPRAMATFAWVSKSMTDLLLTLRSKSTFAHASYAASRPSYPASLYNTVLAFHKGAKKTVLDLGCGTGIVTRALSPHFDRVIGADPSPGMIRQAREKALSNVDFQEGNAETILDTFEDGSIDLVVAGQAAHWFDFDTLWPKLVRVVPVGGSVAFWGYKDHVFCDYPKASSILQHYAYDDDKLGPFWTQPGRSYIQDKLRFIKPPAAEWKDVKRIEYEPATSGPHSGEGTMFMEREMKVGECKAYVRTWSSYHGWTEQHADEQSRSSGGSGDIVDEMFDKIAEEDVHFKNEDNSIRIEWGSGLVMARRG